jgi:hypothetical protein
MRVLDDVLMRAALPLIRQGWTVPVVVHGTSGEALYCRLVGRGFGRAGSGAVRVWYRPEAWVVRFRDIRLSEPVAALLEFVAGVQA